MTKGAAGFVVLHAGERPNIPAGVPAELIDLRIGEGRRGGHVFVVPAISFRIPQGSFAAAGFAGGRRKPGSQGLRRYPFGRRRCARDLARIGQSHALALPFPGKYYLNPRRNYFKLGAAFYWAGYPDRALPYLAETVARAARKLESAAGDGAHSTGTGHGTKRRWHRSSE